MKKLNRNDLSLILGGVEDGDGPTPFKSGGSGGGGDATCIAGCNMREDGSFERYEICSGSNCTATDHEGCKSDTEHKYC